MIRIALVLAFATTFAVVQRPNSEIAADLRALADELSPPEVTVSPGGSIVAAITPLLATGGVVELQAGASYPGPLVLPTRSSPAPLITIRTSGLTVRRIVPLDAPLIATIAGTNSLGAIRAENTAGYRIESVRLTTTGTTATEVVVVENSDNVTFDRVLYCPGAGSCTYASPDSIKRVIRLNGRNLSVLRSHLNAGPYAGQDNQAIAAWQGVGPYTISDNMLLAGSENLLFGGSDNLEGTNPADIFVEGNTIYKPQEWQQYKSGVKNLLELKNATRVTIRGNLLDGCWVDAQSGWAVVFTPVNQDGKAPHTIIKDVLFERNYLRRSLHGLSIKGRGYTQFTQQTQGVVVRQNVLEVAQKAFNLDAEISDLIVADNVIDNGHNVGGLYVGGVREADGTLRQSPTAVFTLTWTGNTFRDAGYGLHSEVGIGTATLNGRTQTWTWNTTRVAGLKYTYPPGTTGIDEATLSAAKASLLAQLGR